MEENNFEKQIQEQLKSLTIHPSPAVWNYVATRIEKKNDRKWLFLLFLGTALILISGIWYYSQTIPKSIGHNLQNPVQGNIGNNNIADHKIDSAKINHPNAVILNELKNESKRDETYRSENSKIMDPGNRAIGSPNGLTNRNSNKKFVKRWVAFKSHSRIINADPVTFSNHNLGEEYKSGPELITSPFLQNTALPYLPVALSDLSINNKIDKAEPALSKQKLPKAKWQFGFKLNAGYSGFTSSLAPQANYVAYAVVLNGYTGAYNVVYPSHITTGPGFIAGMVAEKKMAGRSSFFTGINFKHFTTSIGVGPVNDTNKTYSASGPYHNYTNTMNFLELPVGIKVPLNKSNNKPVFFKGGMSLSQLIYSNALQFNSNGVYAIDNKFFNKTQVNLNAGFSLGFFTKHQNLITVGPAVNVDINPFSSYGIYNGKHLFFVGLDASILFHKSKPLMQRFAYFLGQQ